MTDLHLTFADRPRASLRAFQPLLATLVVAVLGLLYLDHGSLAPLLWLVAVPLLVVPLAYLMTWRAWTRVGPEGISFVDGLGRKRVLNWDRIDWIRVRDEQSPMRYVRVAEIGGKAYSLPHLACSRYSLNPEFDRHAAEVLRLWQQYTGRTPEAEPAAPPARELRVDAAVDRWAGASRNPLRIFYTPRTGFWQGTVALISVIVAFQLIHGIPGQNRAARDYLRTTACSWDGLSGSGTGSLGPCRNHTLESVQSTAMSGSWLHTSSLVLAPTDDNGAYTVQFGSATAWLRSLHPGDRVFVDWVSDGPVTAIGPSTGGTMQRTSDSPDYDSDVSIAAALCFAAFAALFGTWSAALVRQRLRRTRPPFRRWVPAVVPALAVLCALSTRYGAVPGPLTAELFVVPAVLLAAGLGWARWTTARSGPDGG